MPDALPVGDRLGVVYAEQLTGLSAPAGRAALLMALNRSELGFRHPLLRTAVLARATSAQQRSADRSLAEALVADHHSIAGTWHRAEAAAGPDHQLAQDLVRAADDSRTRQGYAAASAAMERAALLTEDLDLVAELLSTAAADAFLAGDADRTRSLVARVLSGPSRPRAQGRALFSLGMLEQFAGSVPRSVELLAAAAERLDGAHRTRALAELALARFRVNDLAGISECAASIDGAADRHDPEQWMLAAFTRGLAATLHGDLAAGRVLLNDVVELICRPPLREDPRSLLFLGLASGFLGDPRRGAELVSYQLNQVRDRGALGVLVPVLALFAAARAWLGDHAGAFADAGEVAELGDQLGYAAHQALTAAFCALCRADPAAAVTLLEARVAADGGVGSMGEPFGVAPYLVEAYLAVGGRDEATAAAARFAAVTPADAPPAMRALVLRCRGLTADDEAAVPAFEAALAAHGNGYDAFETVRTQLLYGARLRRNGQRIRARELLRTAYDAFTAMDLTACGLRAAAELAATGAKPRTRQLQPSEPLTSQETRVALHAAKRNFRSRAELARSFRPREDG